MSSLFEQILTVERHPELAEGSKRDREEILHSVQDDSFESCHPELAEGSHTKGARQRWADPSLRSSVQDDFQLNCHPELVEGSQP